MAMDAIVLYPSPAIGHLISMVELGKLILTQKPSLIVHILVSGSSYNSGAIEPYISGVAAATTAIVFHRLPDVALPPDAGGSYHELLTLETMRLNNPNVRQTLLSFSDKHTLRALIMDFFCIDALPVAVELDIPPFYFITSGAGCLSVILQLPIIHDVIANSAKAEFNNLVFDVPGIPPLPFTDLAKPFQDPEDKCCQLFNYASTSLQQASGFIVNSFDALEARTIRAVAGGECVRDKPTPPVYVVGPLTAARECSDKSGDAPECIAWLNSQPKHSVVFLCFGSLGVFSKEQLGAIAVGLERSGQRFLWVVRNPPVEKDRTVDLAGTADPDLESLLPGGFLGRTKDRGFVIKKWAPQVAVLSHESVGGFVTHSGWNSVLEAVCAGVPMVSWPLYAEQRLNRLLLVEEMKIAFPMEEAEGGFVPAEEVEKRVRQLMDSPEVGSTRERVMALKREAEAAMKDGGSSRAALTKLVEFKK